LSTPKRETQMQEKPFAGDFGGVPQFRNLPQRLGARRLTQADMIMMQQDVAGSLRVSLKSSLSILSPMTGGFQGVEND
jgi:hypothetical protein